MRSVIRIIRGMDAGCSVSPWQLKVNIRLLADGTTFTSRPFPAVPDGWYEVQGRVTDREGADLWPFGRRWPSSVEALTSPRASGIR
jgi:hypothetical protein